MNFREHSIAEQIQQGVALRQAEEEEMRKIAANEVQREASIEAAKTRLLPSMAGLVRQYARETASELKLRGVQPNIPLVQAIIDKGKFEHDYFHLFGLFKTPIPTPFLGENKLVSRTLVTEESVWEIGRFITTETVNSRWDEIITKETDRKGIGLLENGELIEYGFTRDPGSVLYKIPAARYPNAKNANTVDEDRLIDSKSLPNFNPDLAIDAQPVMIRWRNHLARVAVGAVAGESVPLAVAENRRALF